MTKKKTNNCVVVAHNAIISQSIIKEIVVLISYYSHYIL